MPSLSPVPSWILRDIRGTRVSAHQLIALHPTMTIVPLVEISVTVMNRNADLGLEYSISRNMIISWTCCLASAPTSSGERRVEWFYKYT